MREDRFTPSVSILAMKITFSDKFNDKFTVEMNLPLGWSVKASAEEPYQNNLAEIYNGSLAIGTLSYESFELYRSENGDIPYMSVYSGIMLGSGGGWDEEYTPISQTKDTSTAVCKPWHRIDVPGVSGASQAIAESKGILSYDANLLKYVAINFDDQAITQEQLLQIAKSVKLS